jgi:hypothetical protein
LAGQEIRIGGLQTNFWNQVVLKNVSLQGPVAMTCPEVRIHFSWLNFLLVNESPNLGLARIEMMHPVIVFKPSHGNQKRPVMTPPVLAPFWVTWEDADLSVTDPGQLWDDTRVKGLNGWLEISPTSLQTQSALSAAGHGQLILQGKLETDRTRSWTVSLEGKNADLEYFRKSGPPALWNHVPGAVSGSLTGRALARGLFSLTPRTSSWQAAGTLRHGIWRTPGVPTAIPFEARFEADPFRLQILQGTIAKDLQVKGLVKRPWSKTPEAQLNFHTLGGQLLAQGTLRNDQVALTLNGTNLDLAKWAKANGWRNIGGIMTVSLHVNGALENLSAQGDLGIERFTWGSRREKNPMKVRMVYQNHQLTLQSQEDALYLEAGLEGETLALRRFHIISSQDLWIKGSGSVSGPEKTLDLQIEAKGLPITDWPPLAKRYPLAGGHFAFQGQAKGTLKNPLFQGKFSVDDLGFHPGSEIWRLKGTLAVMGQTLELEVVTVNPASTTGSPPDEYQLTLHWTPEQQSGDAALQLTQANPSFLREALGLTRPLIGAMNGHAKLAWKAGHWQSMDVQGSCKNGNIGPLAFEEAELQLGGDDRAGFTLEKLRMQQSSGTFLIQGRLSPTAPDRSWTLLGRFQKAGVGKVLVDGELEAHGSYRAQNHTVSATLSSPSLFLNDHNIGSLRARAAGDRTHLKVFDLVVSGGIEGNLETSFSSHEIHGHLTAHDQDLKEILRRILPESQSAHEESWPSGRVQGEVNIGGTWEDPRLDSTVSVADGLWRQVPFQMDAEIAYAHKLLIIEPIRMTFPTEGEARVEGFLDFESPEPIHLYGEIASLSIPEAVELLGLPPLWNGQVQATAEMEGTLNQPRVSVVVMGEHGPWGPLPAGPLQARLHYDGKVWDIPEAFVGTGDGHIRLAPGSSVYTESPDQGRMRLVAEVRNIHVGPVTFFGGVEIAGLWTVTNEESHPVSWDLAAVAHGLWVNQQRLDGQLARCRIQEKRLLFIPTPGGAQTLSGEISFVRFPVVEIKNLVLNQVNKTRVQLTGTFSPDEFNYSLECQKIEAETLASLFDVSFPITGQVDLVMTASGPLESPFWEGSFLCAQGRFTKVPFDTCRADFSLYNKTFVVKNLKALRGNGYFIKGEGRFPVGSHAEGTPPPSPTFKVSLENGDLEILQDIWPAARAARGQFNAVAEMRKVGGQSILEGRLELRGAKVQSSRYFDRLTDGNATLLLHKNRLEIASLSARMGEGRLLGGGWMEFEGLAPSEYHLFLKTPDPRGISINVPQLTIPPGPLLKKFSLFQKTLATASRGEPKLDVTLKGSASEPIVSGTIFLNNTTFTYPPPPTKHPEEPPQWFTDFVNAATWDITFVAGDRTRYENELVDANLSGSLNLQGRLAEPIVNSELTSERGAFVYAGEEFEIRHAAFEVETSTRGLAGAPTITPYLEAEAEKDIFVPNGIGADTVVMTIPRAPLGEIQPRFQLKSNPGLSSEKVMQLALGLPVATPELLSSQTAVLNQQSLQSQTAQDEYLRAAVVQLFDASFASPLARYMARRSGLVDYIRVYYQPTNDQSTVLTPQQQQRSFSYLQGSGLKVGKELSHRLFANYKFHVDEYENRADLRHEFELAYRLRSSLFLTASTEVVGAGGSTGQLPPNRKAFLENQWRFSPPDLEPAPTAKKTEQKPEKKPLPKNP